MTNSNGFKECKKYTLFDTTKYKSQTLNQAVANA